MTNKARAGKVGRLLVVGGAEDKDEDRMVILPRFVELAGGKKARIIVCSSPSEDVEGTLERYRRVFEKIGVAEVVGAPIEERNEADTPELLEAVERATGVFFTGGDQLRLTALIAGTHFSEGIRHRLFNEGLVVAGTSAGAAAMSSVMLIGGSNEGSVRRADVSLAPGLGLWRDTVVDTHFNQRGRVSRLMTVFAHNPQVLGIGIDENTAVEVELGVRFTVLGENAVMVFNGHVTHSSAPRAGDEDVLALTDALIHVLPTGYGFDLQRHRPLLPGGEVVPVPAMPTSGGSRTAELGTGD
jgi:cyanophycinase